MTCYRIMKQRFQVINKMQTSNEDKDTWIEIQRRRSDPKA